MNLPVGWRNIAIRDIAANERHAFIDGDWIEAPFITKTGIRLIQTGNIGIGTFVNRNKKYISQESFNELKCKDVKAGDILICRLADPIGRSCIVPDLNGRAITSVDVCILRVDNSEYDRNFIAHALNQTTFLAACQERSGGSTRQRISRTNLGTIEILVAEDKLEQSKIAEVLSTLDRAIEQTEALIAKQQRIKVGLMQDLLTRGIDEHGNLRSEQTHKFKDSPLGRIPVEWDIATVDQIASITTGDKDTQDADPSAEYPFFVRSQTVEKISSYSFDGEAVLTAGDGVGTGKVFHYFNGRFDFHQRVYCIHSFTEDILGYYFFCHFQMHFMARVAQFSAKGSVDSVRRHMIAKMLVPKPGHDEQAQFVNILRSSATTLDDHTAALQKLRHLRVGLMHNLLTGERRVTALLGSPKELVNA